MTGSVVLADEGQMHLKRCRHGLMLFNSSDIFIGRSLNLYGEYSHGEADVFARLLRPDMVALENCHLIKIDVEGMELEVLQGAGETLAKHRPALYIENDRKDKSPGLIAHLLAADCRIFWHRPPLFTPDNFFANGDNAFDQLISQNKLCLPSERKFEVGGLVEITSPEAGQGGD